MRKLVATELELLQARREIVAEKNKTTALMILTSALLGAAAGAAGAPAPTAQAAALGDSAGKTLNALDLKDMELAEAFHNVIRGLQRTRRLPYRRGRGLSGHPNTDIAGIAGKNASTLHRVVWRAG